MDKQALMNRYIDMLNSEDSLARAVADYQLMRLGGAEARRNNGDTSGAIRPSKWVHVPLPELFMEHGNAVYQGRGQNWECGHEPMHGSKSGRCVLINADTGYWWCRSCSRRGDAATYVMDLNGWDYGKAAEWLAARYGPPAGGLRRRRRVLEA